MKFHELARGNWNAVSLGIPADATYFTGVSKRKSAAQKLGALVDVGVHDRFYSTFAQHPLNRRRPRCYSMLPRPIPGSRVPCQSWILMKLAEA